LGLNALWWEGCAARGEIGFFVLRSSQAIPLLTIFKTKKRAVKKTGLRSSVTLALTTGSASVQRHWPQGKIMCKGYVENVKYADQNKVPNRHTRHWIQSKMKK
jgi:hypothetical protein